MTTDLVRRLDCRTAPEPSTDPDVYVFSSDGYFKNLDVEGPESQVLVLDPGEYWFEAYDWDYLTSPGGANPCQFVEITSQ